MKKAGLKDMRSKLTILLILTSLLFVNVKATNSTFEKIKINSGDGDINYWAVLIVVGGGQGYRHHAIWGLRSANALINILLNHGWQENNIMFLFEEQATTDAIFNTFQWLNESGEDEDDVILFLFQGHGYNISEDMVPIDEPDERDECYFPWDSDANGWSWDTYIIDDELGAKFNCLKSKNIIGIFETCHSGGWIDGSNDLGKSGRVILTSCAVNEASAPIVSRMRWLFPHYIIQGFKGRADKNSDKFVSAEEVFNYAKLPTMIRSTILNFIVYLIEPVPLTQHPQIYDGWPTEDNNQQELKIIDLAN